MSAGLAIYDIMQFVKCDVSTTCIGMAASMGSLILAGGAKGKRYILPHSKTMLHQPLVGGLSGQASDIEIHAKELLDTKKLLTDIYVKHTGKKFEELTETMDRDCFFNAEQSLAYGIVDKMVQSRKKVK